MISINTYDFINKLENKLSHAAFIPVIPGGCKALLGVIQVIGGMALTVFAALSYPMTQDNSLFKHAFIHLKHGLGNILAGVLEAVPGLGLYIMHLRDARVMEEIKYNPVADFHRDKFMPYDELQKRDLRFYQCDGKIRQEIKNQGGMERLSVFQIKSIAWKTIKQGAPSDDCWPQPNPYSQSEQIKPSTEIKVRAGLGERRPRGIAAGTQS